MSDLWKWGIGYLVLSDMLDRREAARQQQLLADYIKAERERRWLETNDCCKAGQISGCTQRRIHWGTCPGCGHQTFLSTFNNGQLVCYSCGHSEKVDTPPALQETQPPEPQPPLGWDVFL